MTMTIKTNLTETGTKTPFLFADGSPICVGDEITTSDGSRVHLIPSAWEEFDGYWHLMGGSKQAYAMSGKEGEGTHYHPYTTPVFVHAGHIDTNGVIKTEFRRCK